MGIRRHLRIWTSVTLAAALAIVIACSKASPPGTDSAPPPAPDDARSFIDSAEKTLDRLSQRLGRVAWVQETYITDDTEALVAQADSDLTAAVTRFALEARKYESPGLPEEVARKLKLLKLALVAPAPNNDAEREELTKITASLSSDYGKGKYCRQRGGKEECLGINELSKILAASRDPNELKDVWVGWHKVAPPMRQRYARFVELANKGARELGFADTGVMWRSKYDMPQEQFGVELDRLWKQVQPLYLSLHAYVRSQLVTRYGSTAQDGDGRIVAHLLGNMWAQQWGEIYPLVGVPASGAGYDLTGILKSRKTDERRLVKYGEDFFTALGFQSLPATFWERSLFRKPADRDVVCHASAWNLDTKQDVRIKMCVEITAEDFVTVHHELGHNYYTLAYSVQPPLFQAGANDGFHEAIGDAVALSTTPSYLKQIGLLKDAPPPDGDLEYLMKMALDKVAFLPFGLLIDQWRWGVFSGAIPANGYNAAWWDLKQKYQGVAPPVPRSESRFRSGREIPRSGEHSVFTILSRRHPAVPVSPSALPGSGVSGPSTAARSMETSRRAPNSGT